MVNKLLTICKKGDDDMTCRRKTKSSRELVADIHKTFTIFCKDNECNKCKYRYSDNCEVDWIVGLLEKDNKEV